MDNKTKIIIGLVVLIILLVCYFKAVPYYQAKYYTQGYNAGVQNVVSSISNTGQIPVISNGTIGVRPVTEVCGAIITNSKTIPLFYNNAWQNMQFGEFCDRVGE